MCRRSKCQRFAEVTENELPAGTMSEQRKRRKDLEARNSFSSGAGTGFLE